jgi:hypothetical protein
MAVCRAKLDTGYLIKSKEYAHANGFIRGVSRSRRFVHFLPRRYLPKLRKAFDLAILSYEKALLGRSGYSVTTTAPAREGLVLVTTRKFDPVLLDYETPVMNRCDVAVEMKRVQPELAVLLLSASKVPIYALTLVDAFIPKLEASRALLHSRP